MNSTTETTNSKKTEAQVTSRPKWYRIYYLLVILDVFAVSLVSTSATEQWAFTPGRLPSIRRGQSNAIIIQHSANWPLKSTHRATTFLIRAT